MAINWYPGHMHKANKNMKEALPDVDLIIELLDCRLPYSSQNPAIAQLVQDKPSIKILSKSDLADESVTALWQQHFEKSSSVKTLLSTLDQTEKSTKLLQLVHQLVPSKPKSRSHIMAMISGIPNVGKSTLINAVAGRKVAKTGNEPAITKGLQRIKINEDVMFLDTPGILWPKIHNQNSAYRLAASGAIKDTAIEIDDIAMYLSGYLIQEYPQLLKKRYQLDSIPATELEFLEQLGAKRGCLRAGGHVDFEKVSAILVNEFRAGQLGRISLETPHLVLGEELVVARLQKEKDERDKERKDGYKNSQRTKK